MEKNKFYNSVFVMKAGEDKAFANIEGNITKNELVIEEKVISGKNRKIAKFTVLVQNKLEAKYDYALSNYDKTKGYDDKVYVTIVGWDKMAEVLETKVNKVRELLAGGSKLRLNLSGSLKKVTYQGKNKEVSYMELTVPNEDGVRFIFANNSKTSKEENAEINKDIPSYDDVDDGDIPF